LADWLGRARCRRTLAVLAMLADKDAPAVAAALVPLVERWYLAPLAGSRGQTATGLAGRVAGLIPEPVLCDNMRAAVAGARQAATTEDRIVVFGSFHTLEAALASGIVPAREVDACASD